MKIRINKKLFLGVAMALMLFGSTVASAQTINQSQTRSCQCGYSVNPNGPTLTGPLSF